MSLNSNGNGLFRSTIGTRGRGGWGYRPKVLQKSLNTHDDYLIDTAETFDTGALIYESQGEESIKELPDEVSSEESCDDLPEKIILENSECEFCGDPNHRSKFCSVFFKPKHERLCLNCQEFGHIKMNCPKKTQNEKEDDPISAQQKPRVLSHTSVDGKSNNSLDAESLSGGFGHGRRNFNFGFINSAYKTVPSQQQPRPISKFNPCTGFFVCYYCKETGHTTNNCPNKSQSSKASNIKQDEYPQHQPHNFSHANGKKVEIVLPPKDNYCRSDSDEYLSNRSAETTLTE